MKRGICILFSIFIIVASFSIAKGESTATLSSSIPSVSIKMGENVTVDINFHGSVPDAVVSARMEKAGICDLSWGENYRSQDSIVLPLNITGSGVGKTSIKIFVKEHEEISTTIDVEVVGEKSIINFMGIPWFVTVEEFESAMTEKGIEFKTSIYGTGTETYWSSFPGSTFSYDMKGSGEFSYYEASYKAKDDDKYITTVAGYNVSSIDAKFAPSYSGSSIGKPYKLLRAGYDITEFVIPKNLTLFDVYNDISAKITKLYGEPVSDGKGKFSGIHKETYWQAEDGTGICMQYRDIISFDLITITYGVADDTQYINKLYDILREQKNSTINENSDNYDGL